MMVFTFVNLNFKVLSEYPEAAKDDDQQNSSLGESFAELAKRLDEGISLIYCSVFLITACSVLVLHCMCNIVVWC